MAKRLSIDDKLSAIRRLRELPPATEVTDELRTALRDKSNLVVAAAAAIVGDQGQTSLAAELEAAFHRFLVDPVTSDKLCRAKIAVVGALDKLEHEGTDVFLTASTHVQNEPVWGGSEDTAAPLRAAALMALLRLDYHSLLPLLVESLTDSQKEVRMAAAQALGLQGSESARLLLRLKALLGDKEPDVISECLSGLLGSSPKESLPFVSRFLDSSNTAVCEAAILALGRSRLTEAFELLKTCLHRRPIGLTEEIFLAMAMLRLPVATEFMLDIVATGPETSATAALSALLIYRYDPSLRERINDAVSKSGSRVLRAKVERASQTED